MNVACHAQNTPFLKSIVPQVKTNVTNDSFCPIVTEKRFPEARETFPDVRETIPNVRGKIPEIRETIPDVRERIPEVREKVPDVRGKVPDVRETIPDVRGRIPDVREMFPVVRETFPEIKTNSLQLSGDVEQVLWMDFLFTFIKQRRMGEMNVTPFGFSSIVTEGKKNCKNTCKKSEIWYNSGA